MPGSCLREVGPLRYVSKDLETLCGYYATLPKEPLVVRATLANPYVPAESTGAVHLDSLLAYAVYAHLPHPVRCGGADGVVTPLPLKLSYVKDGLPLWAASDLRPQGDTLRESAYWHKRWPDAQQSYMQKRRANVKSGAYKEMRVPLPTVQTPELRALAVGNPEKVHDLLAHVSHVGKKPSQGYGRVARWDVEPLDTSVEEAEATALLARPVPLVYLRDEASGESHAAVRGGFTPPYWFSPWHTAVVTRG